MKEKKVIEAIKTLKNQEVPFELWFREDPIDYTMEVLDEAKVLTGPIEDENGDLTSEFLYWEAFIDGATEMILRM